MARPKRNPPAPEARGTVTQAELLELKFLKWQAQHASEFGLDPVREQDLYNLAAGRIHQKLLDGRAVDPGGLSALLRWGWSSTKGRKWRHASLLVKDAPGKWRAKVEPASDPLETRAVDILSQIDPEREALARSLAFALWRIAAPYATREELERAARVARGCVALRPPEHTPWSNRPASTAEAGAADL